MFRGYLILFLAKTILIAKIIAFVIYVNQQQRIMFINDDYDDLKNKNNFSHSRLFNVLSKTKGLKQNHRHLL